MTPLEAALVEEAAKKSALVWVRGPEGPARALWHVWHDGAVCLVGDGSLEQPLTGMGLADGGTATVSLRSKDKGGRLVVWRARVAELAPHGERWEAAVGALRGKRLNAPDTPRIAERWADESRVLRLEPAGQAVRTSEAMPDDSHAAVPLPTPATTRVRAPRSLPRLLLRRRGRGRSGGG